MLRLMPAFAILSLSLLPARGIAAQPPGPERLLWLQSNAAELRAHPQADWSLVYGNISRGELSSLDNQLADVGLRGSLILRAPGSDLVRWHPRSETQRFALRAALSKSPEVLWFHPASPATEPGDARIPDFTHLQLTLQPAELGGFGITPTIRGLAGGWGENAQIADVEDTWSPHVDIADASVRVVDDDINPYDMKYLQLGNTHGTMMLGIMAAQDNGFGTTGITPSADFLVSSTYRLEGDEQVSDIAGALLDLLPEMSPGGIVLIEQQLVNPLGVMIPVEYDPAINLAITTLIDAGLVVIEPLGNGGIDIGPYVDPEGTGAILVGAGASAIFDESLEGEGPAIGESTLPTGTMLQPTFYQQDYDLQGCATSFSGFVRGDSPYVERMVQGHGYRHTLTVSIAIGNERFIPSLSLWTGAGMAYDFTAMASGTSSASAIVAGLAGLIQSVNLGAGLPPLDATEMRELMRETGIPQPQDEGCCLACFTHSEADIDVLTGAQSRAIGPRVDVSAALAALGLL